MDDITLKNYYEMFTAAWKLFREFKNLHTDEDRERIKYAATMIYHKYPCQLMMDLIWAVFNELDRRMKLTKESKKESPQPKVCYLCGKEILPEEVSVFIQTKRRSKLYIHNSCMKQQMGGRR